MDARLFEFLSAGATVLTASRRLAHHLHAQYAATAQDRGRMVWPTPAILPWSAFLLEACKQHRAAQPQAPRLLSELQTQALWESIVAASETAARLLNPAQAARNAARSWQRLHEYQIPLAQIAAADSEEARVFAEWALAFVTMTARKRWLDAARVGEYLIQTQYTPDRPLSFYGFDRLTPEMKTLIAAWRERGCEVDIPASAPPASNIQVTAANDGRHELETAARWARRQMESGKSSVAVVVADLNKQAAQARRVFSRIFTPDAQRIGAEPIAPPFTIAASRVLGEYAVVHHALLLLQLAQGHCDTLAVGQLLRSPFMAGYESEYAARANAEITAREARREYWDVRALERFAGANGCMQLSQKLQQMAQAMRDTGRALPSQWTERLSLLLRLVGWPEGRALNSEELQTVIKLREVMADLSALDEVLDRIDFARALEALRDGCMATRFAPESEEQAVTVIDANTVAGMRFDALWVTGLHAGNWPSAPQPDPFLPLELQRRFGLPEATAENCLHTAKLVIDRLLSSASEVVLSWPRHDDEAELQPSALLRSWPHVEIEALSLSPVNTLRDALFKQRPELELFSDDRAPAAVAGVIAGGTRSLELQSRCPFRAHAELRLHAKPLPSVSPAVEPTERGKLVHKVLAEFWQQLKSSQALRELTEAEWAACLRDIATRVAQSDMPTTTVHRQRLIELEVELAVQWILALLRVEAQRESFTVHQTEQREQIQFASMQLNIQLDRIDELPDGSWLLIDYKTGGSNHAKDWLDINVPNRPRSPQLPLYALAHRQNLAGIAYAVLSPGESGFRGLANRAALTEGIEHYDARKPRQRIPGVDTWEDLLRHWQDVLNSLAAGYLGGDARVDPLKGECDYCHLAGLCRVRELVEQASEDEEDGDE